MVHFVGYKGSNCIRFTSDFIIENDFMRQSYWIVFYSFFGGYEHINTEERARWATIFQLLNVSFFVVVDVNTRHRHGHC